MGRFGLIALLAVGVHALPDAAALDGSLLARAACNRDNCFRQVAASATPGGPARGSAGCSVALATTVTPCPVTATTTATVISTFTLDVSITNTVVTTVTSPTTTTTTATVTVTTVVGGAARKRGLEARITPVCVPASTSSTTIPRYASSCRSFAQYSSACSCNGVTGSATTLPAVTSTVTATSTSMVTETDTVISVVTVTMTEAPVVTATTTSTVTVTSTASTGPPICNAPSGGSGGGCSNGCNCDPSPDLPGNEGYCDNGVYTCALRCTSSSDCLTGQICAANPVALEFCGGPVCAAYSSCTSTYDPSTEVVAARGDMFGLFGAPGSSRM